MNIEAFIKAAIDTHAARLEEACEIALLTGTDGVLVTWEHGSIGARIEVTDEVPYGNIYEVRA